MVNSTVTRNKWWICSSKHTMAKVISDLLIYRLAILINYYSIRRNTYVKWPTLWYTFIGNRAMSQNNSCHLSQLLKMHTLKVMTIEIDIIKLNHLVLLFIFISSVQRRVKPKRTPDIQHQKRNQSKLNSFHVCWEFFYICV